MFAVLSTTLTSCASSTSSDGGSANPSVAKKTVVDVVERSTAAVGGSWQVYRGPAVEPCGDAPERVRYVFIMERTAAAEGQQADIDAVKDVWKDEGIEFFDTRTGGDDPVLGIRGKGGPVTSIGFNARPARYSISGVSTCAAGDASHLRDEEFPAAR